MRGQIEVYSGDKLLLRESNLIMDGASELLADIMSISPSVSSLGNSDWNTDKNTSSILDASNYRIAAISFGTAASSYQNNAHEYLENKALLLSGNTGSRFRGASALCLYLQYGGDSANNDGDPVGGLAQSYNPVPALTSPPNPALSGLEVQSDVSAIVGAIPVSSVIAGNGQNLNLIPREYHYARLLNTDLSSLSSVAASFIGCWPEGSGAGGTGVSGFSGTDFVPGDVCYSRTFTGHFNEASSMDTSGFVNMIMSSVPNTDGGHPDGYGLSSAFSGLTLSASVDSNMSWSSTGEVVHIVGIGADDLAMATLYGGIYNMGLWTIDVGKTLQEGNTPPYSFDPLNNPRKYRLFSTKSLTKNLGYARTVQTGTAGTIYPALDNYENLVIKWRIYFNQLAT
jgi:hypothetical protein